MKIINNRRSVRKFQDKKVESTKIDKLLRAAMQAPSAANQQPWEFIVVQDELIMSEIANTHTYSALAKSAPLVIVLAANLKRMRVPTALPQDLGACTQNILLEVVNQGLGATWVGVHPSEQYIEYIQKLLKMPKDIIPYNIIVIGYPANDDANHFVDRFDESRIHWENY